MISMPSTRSTASRPRPSRHRPAHETGETISAGHGSRRLFAFALPFALPTVLGATMVVGLTPTVAAAGGSRPASIASTTIARRPSGTAAAARM
jgi:hypothetical protein